MRENFSSSCSTCSFTSPSQLELFHGSLNLWYSLDFASTAMPSSALMAFSSSLRKYSRWLLEIFSLSCSWIFFWIFSSSCSFLMKMSTCSMRACTSFISRIFCCSARSMLRMEVMKSAIFPGWSMLTMERRISSENSGLFSDTCFISLMSARVSAFTSG